MRPRHPDVLEARAANSEETVAHAQDELGDDGVLAVVPEEVVHVRDRAGVRVFDGDDRGVGLAVRERAEDFGERAPGDERRLREERGRCRLGERSGESLVGDVHR
jgi:hypothetical protein